MFTVVVNDPVDPFVLELLVINDDAFAESCEGSAFECKALPPALTEDEINFLCVDISSKSKHPSAF